MNEDEIGDRLENIKRDILIVEQDGYEVDAAWVLSIEKRMHELRVLLRIAYNVCPESGLSDCITEHCGIHGRIKPKEECVWCGDCVDDHTKCNVALNACCVVCGVPRKKWQRCPDGVLCVFED